MSDEWDDVEAIERRIHEELDALRREYELRARPLVQQLLNIANCRLRTIVITRDELLRIGIPIGAAKP